MDTAQQEKQIAKTFLWGKGTIFSLPYAKMQRNYKALKNPIIITSYLEENLKNIHLPERKVLPKVQKIYNIQEFL